MSAYSQPHPMSPMIEALADAVKNGEPIDADDVRTLAMAVHELQGLVRSYRDERAEAEAELVGDDGMQPDALASLYATSGAVS